MSQWNTPCCDACGSDPCGCCDATAPTPVPPPTCPEPCAADEESICKVWEDVDCFTVPAVGSTIPVGIVDSDDWEPLVGGCVTVTSDGVTVILRIDSVDTSANQLILNNQGYAGNPAAGTVLTGDCVVSHMGACPIVPGQDCIETYALTDAVFNVPALGATAQVTMDRCFDAVIGQRFFVSGLGRMILNAIVSNDPVSVWTMETECLLPGVTVGSVLGTGAFVTPSEHCEPLLSDFQGRNTGSQVIAETIRAGAIGGIIAFNTEDWDALGDFDLANDRFIAPYAGVFEFHAGAVVNNGYADDYSSIEFLLNGTTLIPGLSNSLPAENGDDHSLTAYCKVELALNDFVEVVFVTDAAVADPTLNTTIFNGHCHRRT